MVWSTQAWAACCSKSALPMPQAVSVAGIERYFPRIGSRYVFLHGFAKSDKASITADNKKRCNLPAGYFSNYLLWPWRRPSGQV